MSQPMQNDPPLAGINVLEFAQMVAGPAAGLWLADYGANVIKIEPPAGDGGRALRSSSTVDVPEPPLFAAYNRNKTSTRLDLKTEEGRRAAWALLEKADVVIESSSAGAMDRLGLGADAVLARYPALVYASVSGFGWTPAGLARRAVDLIVQAESGMMSITGAADGPPTKVGFTAVDAACGHALCHGILAALFRRTRTGRGGLVRISLYEVALNMQTGPIADYLVTGQLPLRTGNSAPHSAPSDLFECSDGHVIVAAYLPDHWARLLRALERPELGEDPRFASSQLRVKNRDALCALLSTSFRRESAAHWLAHLDRAGILVAKVRSYDEVVAADITRESGVLLEGNGVCGVRSPIDLVGTPRLEPRPLRTIGSSDIEF